MTADWLTTEQVATSFCVSSGALAQGDSRDDLLSAVGMKFRENGGYLYARADVERVRTIMTRARLKFGQACRVWAAIKKEGPL